MARHRMTNHEYEQLRDAIRHMRTTDPQLTPAQAREKVNGKLTQKMSHPSFMRQWRLAEPKRNGRRNGTAVVHVEGNKNAVITPIKQPATEPDSNRSRLRIVLVDAEVGEADLDQLAQTIGALLAGRS